MSRGEPLVISLARLFLFAEKKIFSAMSLGLPAVLRHARHYASESVKSTAAWREKLQVVRTQSAALRIYVKETVSRFGCCTRLATDKSITP